MTLLHMHAVKYYIRHYYSIQTMLSRNCERQLTSYLLRFHTRNCASSLHRWYSANMMTEKVLMLLSVTHRVWICDGTVWPTEKTLLMMSQEKEARSAGQKTTSKYQGGTQNGKCTPRITHTNRHPFSQAQQLSHFNSQPFTALLAAWHSNPKTGVKKTTDSVCISKAIIVSGRWRNAGKQSISCGQKLKKPSVWLLWNIIRSSRSLITKNVMRWF